MLFLDPILKNGTRGSPILLKRPKDATVLKVHTGYKTKTQSSGVDKIVRREKPVRMVRTAVTKERENLVCPVCVILTFTLGNHIATHQGIYKLILFFYCKLASLCGSGDYAPHTYKHKIYTLFNVDVIYIIIL